MFKFSDLEREAALDMMYCVRESVYNGEYICDAIKMEMADAGHKYPFEAVGRIIVEEIARRLGSESATYSSWLWKNHRDFCIGLGLIERAHNYPGDSYAKHDLWVDQYVPGRLSFVDGLIEEIEYGS